MLSVVQKIFFGPITKRENEHVPDINARELVAVAPLIIMIFVIGLFPNIFLSRMKDAVDRVESEYSARLEANSPPRYYDGPVRLLPRNADTPPLPTDLAAGSQAAAK
jgi:NADH-quinone oxidoreductase subunit M